MTPPRLAEWLLRLAAGEDFEAISGDLEEAMRTEIEPRRGRARAAIWYSRPVACVITARVLFRLRPNRDGNPQHSRKRTGLEAIGQDLSYALRALRAHPTFTVVAVLTLGLGIGANVAIFSIVNAVLFKPLPFAEPARLMAVHLLAPDPEHPGVLGKVVWSYPKYDGFRTQQRVFESIAFFTPDQWNVTGSSAPERVLGESIEATYLGTLGVVPTLGRGFTIEETRAKFATSWEPRFVIYKHVLDLPRLALALVKLSEMKPFGLDTGPRFPPQ